jgi:hypothetical protein
MMGGADVGAIPAKVSENIRPIMTPVGEGVELVNPLAAPMYAPTAGGATAWLQVWKPRHDRSSERVRVTSPRKGHVSY